MGRRVSSSRAARNPAGLSGELLVSNGDMQLVNVVGSGLEEKLVNLLPVCQYVGLVQEGIKERHHECAVCLSFFEEKEMVRVLPKCHHIFHLHCIDKWFESHANCPLCRERITLQTIQLSFSTPDHHKHDDHHHPHLPPPPPPPPSDAPFLLHAHHQPDGSLPCHLHDPLPHQNIFLSAASATNVITNPHTAEAAPPDHTAASADARKDAGFTCGFESLCDHNPFLIPAVTAESTKYIRHDAESEEEYRVARINQAATRESTFAKEARAIYSGDDQSAGSICALNDHSNRAAAVSDRSVGGSVHGEEAADEYRIVGSQRRSLLVEHKKLQEVQNAGEIDDEKTAGTSNCEAEDQSLLAVHGVEKVVELKSAHQRLLSILIASPHPKISRSPFSLLRRSLSTGCLIESDAKASHATDPHGTTLLYEML